MPTTTQRLPLSRTARLRSGLPDERLARNVRVPVYECAIRIIFPRPDMQRVKRRKSEAVGRGEVVEDLSHELRGDARMCRVPATGDHQIVRASQLHAAIGLSLIEHDLRTANVDDAVAHQRVIYIMETHGAEIVSADAAELQPVSGGFGGPHSLRARRRFPHRPDQGATLALLLRGNRCMLMSSWCERAYREDARQC